MIFDRTQNDVDAAIRLRAEKVQTFQELTESEIAILEKGMITVNTLNRIDDTTATIKGLINEMGYWNTPVKTSGEWASSHIFKKNHLQTLIDNINILRQAFFVYNDTPSTPPVSYHWEDINALEKILYDLDVMINDVKSNYKFCGDFECGE